MIFAEMPGRRSHVAGQSIQRNNQSRTQKGHLLNGGAAVAMVMGRKRAETPGWLEV
jgi:hypothetical protein